MSDASPLPLFDHEDALKALNLDVPLGAKLQAVHAYLRELFPFVSRIAVALYEPTTDLVKTFAHSSDGDNPLPLYQARLSEAASLKEIADKGRPRVVNDLEFFGGEHEHSQRLREAGFGASYTMPIFRHSSFFGFLFFNSRQAHVFDETTLRHIDLVGHLLAMVVVEAVSPARALVATVRSATTLARHRDFETGAHLERMSHYARLVAREIAAASGHDDTWVELVFLFAPLHDLGKIAIRDDILLKPGKLSVDEYTEMKTHPRHGREIVDTMLRHFELDGLEHVHLLRNIVLHHHEAVDGSGYPMGLAGDDIPIEARVVAVADVFDALTSRRSYKAPWPIDDALHYLVENADNRFDRQCVAALVKHRAEIEAIRARFGEDAIG